MKYFKVFGRKYYILKVNIKGKLDTKSEEGIFLRYSTKTKAHKCLNTNTKKVVESTNVNFDKCTKVHGAKPMKELEQ